MSISLDEVSEIINKISKFTDEEIELFVQLSIKEDPNCEPDELRSTLKNIQKK